MIFEDRRRLKYLVDILIESIDQIGKSFNKTKPGVRNRNILNLLFRIRCNLTGISELLNFWPESNAFQPPISILYRTIVTDCITTLYLLTFYEHEESFQNELRVLNIKYVKSIEKYIDNIHTEMPGASMDEVNAEKEKQRQQLYNSNRDILIEGTTNIKSPQDLRATSDHSLFLKPVNIKRNLGDTEMFDQITLHRFTNGYSQIFNLYKYFSQHQHYSTAGNHISTFPPEIELRQWIVSTTHIWEIIIRLAKFFSVQPAVQLLESKGDLFTKFRSLSKN